jgi:hypothetical protein
MHIRLDHNIYTTNTIKFNFIILVIAPVAHASHVFAVGFVLFVSCVTNQPVIPALPGGIAYLQQEQYLYPMKRRA